MALALTACGKAAPESSSAPAAEASSAKIVATIYPVYSMANAIAPDQVAMLLPPGADMHHYDLRPDDMKRLEKADLVLYGGDAAEPWAAEIREALGEDGPRWVDASAGIELLKDEAGADLLGHRADEAVSAHEHDHDAHEGAHAHDGEAHEHEHEHDGEAHEHEHDHDAHEGHHHGHGGVDPHYWTSLRHAMTMTDTLAKAIAEVDGIDANATLKAAQEYKAELAKLDGEYSAFFRANGNRPLVVADRFPFRYLANDYHIPFAALYESCDEESDFSPKRLARLEDFIKGHPEVSTLYYTELTEPKVAKELARDTDKRTAMLNAAHEVSKEDMDKGLTYLDIVRANLQALKEGLSA